MVRVFGKEDALEPVAEVIVVPSDRMVIPASRALIEVVRVGLRYRLSARKKASDDR